ncbi:hypothetical protein MTsPCn5_15120 [Croceitalea sp. MTPC5]|uniref:serine hydrolase domain-containing protein n=1 Tax=Croceitalea sp. MTPC5 TaxID=3056565 RepID=UPI002B378686|nr:hypothetical protein MTsPCn5_15120 [Croceitalea sp. MTPC5]
MKSKIKIYCWILIMTVFFCCESKRDSSRVTVGLQPSVEDTLNIKIPQWQTEYNVPAVAVGLIEDGQVKMAKVYGEHQKGSKASVNTIFNVASIAKTVVAMTTLKLIDNGQWDLDEPLHNYWVDPDVINDSLSLQLTTRHILNHTTGFKNWRRMYSDQKLSFDFKPGTRYQYSGEGFEYLSAALEKRFDIKWTKLVDSLVFKPMDMKDATFTWLKDVDTLRFAHWYDGNGIQHDVYYKTHWVSAADDLLVTINDLSNFGIEVMKGNFISQDLFNQMVTPQIKIHNNADYGLGWTIIKDLPNGEYAINHDGGDAGVATTMVLLPNSKNGIIVLTNGDNGSIICKKVIKEVIGVGKEIVNKIYWGTDIPNIVDVSEERLKKYAGIYKSTLGTQMNFIKKKNTLEVYGTGIPRLTLYPESENAFFPLDFDIRFVFREDDKGNVNSIDIVQGGKVTLTGIRENNQP